jgi:hypothetical protein
VSISTVTAPGALGTTGITIAIGGIAVPTARLIAGPSRGLLPDVGSATLRIPLDPRYQGASIATALPTVVEDAEVELSGAVDWLGSIARITEDGSGQGRWLTVQVQGVGREIAQAMATSFARVGPIAGECPEFNRSGGMRESTATGPALVTGATYRSSYLGSSWTQAQVIAALLANAGLTAWSLSAAALTLVDRWDVRGWSLMPALLAVAGWRGRYGLMVSDDRTLTAVDLRPESGATIDVSGAGVTYQWTSDSSATCETLEVLGGPLTDGLGLERYYGATSGDLAVEDEGPSGMTLRVNGGVLSDGSAAKYGTLAGSLPISHEGTTVSAYGEGASAPYRIFIRRATWEDWTGRASISLLGRNRLRVDWGEDAQKAWAGDPDAAPEDAAYGPADRLRISLAVTSGSQRKVVRTGGEGRGTQRRDTGFRRYYVQSTLALAADGGTLRTATAHGSETGSLGDVADQLWPIVGFFRRSCSIRIPGLITTYPVGTAVASLKVDKASPTPRTRPCKGVVSAVVYDPQAHATSLTVDLPQGESASA